jgi:hypothetical protein
VLFRIWMAAALALVLAVALPLAGLALQGVAPPPLASATAGNTIAAADATTVDSPEKLAADLIEQLREAVMAPRGSGATPPATPEGAATESLGLGMRSTAQAWWDNQRLAIDQWWRSLAPVQRGSASALAGLGALLGVLLGLIGPYTSAAIQSSLIGGVCALFGLGRLGELNPEGLLAGLVPQSPVQLVSLLGLITLVGVGLQWTLWRRRADK